MEVKEAFQGKQKEWAKVIAQAWADEDFKKKLLADPKAVLKENGIEFPENIRLNILEGKADEFNLTLPPRPAQLGTIEEIGALRTAYPCPFCSGSWSGHSF